MVIYGEVLFLENAIVGALILWVTAVLCSAKISRRNLILGAALCGCYSFTLFQGEIHWLWALLEKLLFSMVLIRLCFEFRRYLCKLLVFYGTSFLFGGVTMGLFGLLSVPAMSANGSLYVEQLSFFHLVSGISAALLILRLFLALLREHRYELRTKRQVTIVHQGKRIRVQGFLDTGNRLMDPETGLPVCLVSHRLWEALQGEEAPLRMITYRGASGYERMLAILEPDGFQIAEKGQLRRCQTVLGLGTDQEEGWNWAGYQILLNGYFSDELMGYGGEIVG